MGTSWKVPLRNIGLLGWVKHCVRIADRALLTIMLLGTEKPMNALLYQRLDNNDFKFFIFFAKII